MSVYDHFLKSEKKRTPEEREALKQNWLRDPCWDIWETEGFEAHELELRTFQAEQEAEWKNEEQKRLERKACALGVPGNLKLAGQFIILENTISNIRRDFEKRLQHIEENAAWRN